MFQILIYRPPGLSRPMCPQWPAGIQHTDLRDPDGSDRPLSATIWSRIRINAVFRPREGQIATRSVQQWPGKTQAPGITSARLSFDRGAAGLRTGPAGGRFCRTPLAWGIVNGAAKAGELFGPVGDQILAMATRHQKHQVGKRDSVRQSRRQCVASQVIDADQRQTGRRAQIPLAHMTPDITPPIRPGPAVTAMASMIIEGNDQTGCFQMPAQRRYVQLFCMRPGRDLGDDAAKSTVQTRFGHALRMTESRPRAPDGLAYDGRGRIVTAAFQSPVR